MINMNLKIFRKIENKYITTQMYYRENTLEK